MKLLYSSKVRVSIVVEERRRLLLLLSYFCTLIIILLTPIHNQDFAMQDLADPRDTLKVLITRTVSPSEVSIVQKDVEYVQSFYSDDEYMSHLQKSTQHCDLLKASMKNDIFDDRSSYFKENTTWELKDELSGSSFSPYTDTDGIGSQFFPNLYLCDEGKNNNQHDLPSNINNYISVQANFMLLFATSSEVAQELNTAATLANATNTAQQYSVDIDIVDVSSHPKKLWNWLSYTNKDRLEGYDYVWFIDGDIKVQSLNWQAFWQQIRIMKTKISQPVSIGSTKANPHGSVFKTLVHQPDLRILSAEVPIIEVQAPLLEVETWLRYCYRDFIYQHPELVESMS